jgi:DcmR-like sensory protein
MTPIGLTQVLGTPTFPPFHHSVEFYEPGLFPAAGIAEYFRSGLQVGEAILTVATTEHVKDVRESLLRSGVNVRELENAGICTWVEAEKALETLRANDGMTQETVDAVLCPALSQVVQASPSGRVRVFGELVNLLAESGKFAECVRLETFWNKIADRMSLQGSLHCAYCTQWFEGDWSPSVLLEICETHHEVKPPPVDRNPISWLAVVLEQQRALQSARREMESLHRQLEHSDSNEIARFRERVVAMMEAGLLRMPAKLEHWHSDALEEWNRLVKRTLKDILDYCGEVMVERRRAATGSAEWHRRTGEILACARLTSLVSRLEDWQQSEEGNTIN